MPLNTVTADQATGLLKTTNNLSEIRAYTDQLTGVGDVKLIASLVVPRGWLACDGTRISASTYAPLFAKLGYTFGGSGANFNLPTITAPAANTMYVVKAAEYTP